MDQFTQRSHPLRVNDRPMPTGQGRWQVGERAVRTPCAKSGVGVTMLCANKEMEDREMEDHRCEGRSLLIFFCQSVLPVCSASLNRDPKEEKRTLS